MAFIRRLYAAGLSSKTIAELMPCVETPSEESRHAALSRMHEERDRLTAHIAELVSTRNSLDALIAANLAYGAALAPSN